MKFLSLKVMEISLTKNLERKKKEQTKGRTNRRMHICNPTIQLVVVDLYTKYEVSILNGCGDIFDEKVLRNYGRTDGTTDGTTDGNTDRCKSVYPPLFQSGGIITIIKSLAISKFTHMFLALPSPPEELVKRLDKIFYRFLWNSGPDRIKRTVIIKDIQAGGLRMISIKYFIKALKISWLRRIIQNSHDLSWSSLSMINFQKMFSFGHGYADQLKANIANPF